MLRSTYFRAGGVVWPNNNLIQSYILFALIY